jgi:hypothetical protein
VELEELLVVGRETVGRGVVERGRDRAGKGRYGGLDDLVMRQ